MNTRKISIVLFTILLVSNMVTPYVYAQENTSPSAEASDSAKEPFLKEDLPSIDASMQKVLPVLESLDSKDKTAVSATVRQRIYVKKLLKNTYQAREKVSVFIGEGKDSKFKLTLLDNTKQPVSVNMKQSIDGDDRTITISAPAEIKPGKYTLEVRDEAGVVSEQNFMWGVLALNPDRSFYLPGEKASFAIAVLDERGEMVCNADVSLQIQNPESKIQILSTKTGEIQVNPGCSSKRLTLTPDYQASYTVGDKGTYTMTLTATTKSGEYSISDSIEVKDELPFRIKRLTATRLYPPLTYPVVMELTPSEDFDGTVTEVVPEDFTVSPLDEASNDVKAIAPLDGATSYDRVEVIQAGSLENQFVLGASTLSLSLPFEADSASPSAEESLKKYPETLGFGQQLDDPEQKIKYQDFGLLGHDGLDFAMPIGTEVLSVDAGTVVLAEENSDYGTTIVVQHEWGNSYYGHLSKIDVKVGEHVAKGILLGLSGDTGITTGPHLHFGVKLSKFDKQNGYFGKVDPAPYLGLPSDAQVLGASSSTVARVKAMTFKISAKKGQTVRFGYLFKAPNKSPQFYTLGPLRVFDDTGKFVFNESRAWQLAVDAYAGTQVKTIEYILGGGTDTTSRATTNVVYAGSSWNTTKGSAGTESVFISGTNISVRNAYLEARTIRQTAANITDVDMTFDANPGPNAGSDTRVSPVVQNGNNYQGSTGLSQWMTVRADVTSQFETQSDSDWSTGVAVVGSLSVTGPSFAASTMKLVVTYESDYSTASHTEIKTVRFPLDSNVAGDTGSTRAACGASATCNFAYNAQIPDLLSGSNANIKSVFFELHGNSDSATAPSITPQISGGTAGTAVSDQEIIADERDLYVLYKPIVGGSDFSPNSAQTLSVVNGTVAVNTLGGELVVTYLYSTGAATQTDTVRYWIQQQTAESGTSKTAFPDGPSNIGIVNTGLSVKNLWYRVHTAHGAAETFTVYGKVGSASEKSNAYTLTGTNARAGETSLVYDMSADAASFSSSTTKITGSSQFSSATGDTEVGVELFVTFTWTGSSGGAQTKTVLYNSGTSPTSSVVATEYHNFPVNIFLPETVTKTHRSTYVESAVMHSQSATTISVATPTVYLNGGSILALSEQDDTEAFSRTYVASVSASLFTGDSSPTANTIGFARRAFAVSNTLSNANIITASNVFVVTYDADFSGNGTAESSKSLRTVEFSLGGGSDATSRATTVVAYAGSSWNTVKATAGTVSVAIPGSGIQVRNAYLESRIVSTASTATTDVDMTFDATPGPEGGTDGRVSPVIQGTYYTPSGLSYWILVRANVASQLSTQSDSDWNAGVDVVASLSTTGPTTQLNSMKLVITYEQDYSETAHDELKSVRFPLDSSVAGDTGSKRSACAASTTCSFAYNAQIPDLLAASNANIESVFFELHGDSDSATAPSITPQINGGTAGSALAEGDVVSDMRDLYAIYNPLVGGSDFSPNSAQTLDIVNGTVALNALGGELVVTYKFSTGASVQTDTVRFFSQQQTAESGVAKTAFSNSSYTISNTGLSVKNIWYNVHTAQSAANTLTIYGKVGAATEKSNAYTLTGTNARAGEAVVIYDMSADAASFNAATTTVTGNSQWSSATGDTEVGAEMYVTFTWTGSSLGAQTKSVLYNAGTAGAAASVATEYENFASYIFLPENVTKTYRSAYIVNTLSHSNATTISVGTVTLYLNGVSGLSLTEQDDTEAFSRTYLEEISSSDFSGGATIGFQRKAFELTNTLSVANRYAYSNLFVVTYDEGFADPPTTPTLDQLMRHGKWFNNGGVRQPFTF